ncbi:YueI family protein [Priestia taiwanensis]|uniref:DUF1694 domain-containing protein n=1 Tax=Priestia taiwanensis TaxID=1347902 RepID=A0A917ALD4_9BACI|nr:YueI family protein [Priestia taiwanensis]MBM7362130.1 uncharacterized protein YueI [Priestia taiwanensis]GGE59707.1 hypothetical protein GCM10007140_07530 [Priestia taiwanensis]
MKKNTVDDYLNNGIYGTPEIKGAERKVFLGTIRERIEIALTNGQVMKSTTYKEIESAMKQAKNTKLLLNGNIAYSYLSKYIKLANQHNIPFSLVQDSDSKNPMGLVLTHDVAINKENIFVEDDTFKQAKQS